MSEIVQLWRKVRGVVLRRGATHQDADDIVQEAFARLEAYTRVHELRSREAFLVTAALNISRDQARRSAHGPVDAGELDLEAIADANPQPEERLWMKERLRRMSAGLEQLEPQTRRCLLAQRLDGLPFPQVAEKEGLSVAAVEKRVARALVFLTQWMDEA
ncbi:MAG TPA: sigma-70 family RNA polymerase sigma factor [Roseateles sp.]|nr:sigma-70 family RNA polymerase sigma factor [Roseateles sp.]